MPPFILISILVFALIVLGALIAVAIVIRNSSSDTTYNDQESHPQGYWIGIGMSIGAGFGVAMGLVFDNLALGMAMGAGFGLALGTAYERRNAGNLRPRTEQELTFQKWGIAAGVLILLLMVGIFTFLLFLRR
jgi:hypothetical protein